MQGFKARLDTWLRGVRDCPATVGCGHDAFDAKGCPSNSLLAWSKLPGFGPPVSIYRAPPVSSASMSLHFTNMFLMLILLSHYESSPVQILDYHSDKVRHG